MNARGARWKAQRLSPSPQFKYVSSLNFLALHIFMIRMDPQSSDRQVPYPISPLPEGIAGFLYDPKPFSYLRVRSKAVRDRALASKFPYLLKAQDLTVDITHGELSDSTVLPWLETPVSLDDRELRIIFTPPVEVSLANWETIKHPLPFSRATFERMVNEYSFHVDYFRMPPNIAKSFANGVISFYLESYGAWYRLAQVRVWGSYRPQSGIATYILHGFSDVQLNRIRQRLHAKEIQRLMFHPLLVFVIVVESLFEACAKKQTWMTVQVYDAINRAGRNGDLIPHLEEANLDIEFENKEMAYSQLTLASTRMIFEQLLMIETNLLRWAKEIELDHSADQQKMNFSAASELICDRLEYLSNKIGFELTKPKRGETVIQSHRQTLDVLNATAANKLNMEISAQSRDIARDSKRDSSAMKAIAVLTMCFLPATFLATLFALKPVENLITPRFWIYWAITLPATAVVLLTWRIWYLFEEWRWSNGKKPVSVWRDLRYWLRRRGRKVKDEETGGEDTGVRTTRVEENGRKRTRYRKTAGEETFGKRNMNKNK